MEYEIHTFEVVLFKQSDISEHVVDACLWQTCRNVADFIQLFCFECFFQTAVEFDIMVICHENGEGGHWGYFCIVDI